MKKEGIQTRNRKLSSKSKKKKGCLGFQDVIGPLDKAAAAAAAAAAGFPSFASAGSAGLGASMSHYVYNGQMHAHGTSMGAGGFASAPSMHHPMSSMGGLGLGSSSSALGLGSTFGLAASNSMVSHPIPLTMQSQQMISQQLDVTGWPKSLPFIRRSWRNIFQNTFQFKSVKPSAPFLIWNIFVLRYRLRHGDRTLALKHVIDRPMDLCGGREPSSCLGATRANILESPFNVSIISSKPLLRTLQCVIWCWCHWMERVSPHRAQTWTTICIYLYRYNTKVLCAFVSMSLSFSLEPFSVKFSVVSTRTGWNVSINFFGF